MKKISLAIVYLFGCLLIVGSAAGPPPMNKDLKKVETLGNFTAASSHNIRGLAYSKSNNTSVHVEGKSCYPIVNGQVENQEGSLQIAMDNAIAKGQGQGIDGDLLVNVRMKKETYLITQMTQLPRYEVCYVVSGDLVNVK